ncbi:hypothetical protein IP69_10310 [Bosea sp. AAP35]|nr:hypothetical protein IP69_10310 [Bosea sp. AAP35]
MELRLQDEPAFICGKLIAQMPPSCLMSFRPKRRMIALLAATLRQGSARSCQVPGRTHRDPFRAIAEGPEGVLVIPQ